MFLRKLFVWIIIEDYDCKHLFVVSAIKTYKAMKEALTSSEVVDYLDFNPEIAGSDVTLLGLKADQLHPNDSHKMVNTNLRSTIHTSPVKTWCFLLKVLQQGLIPELENRLKSKCEQIAQYHETSKSKG